jgi:hypothetical protein
MLLHGGGHELSLQLTGKVLSPGKDYDSSRIGIEPMHRPQFLRVVYAIKNPLQGIAVESARGMQWQGSGLIDDNDRGVLMKHANGRVHVRLRVGRHPVQISLARPNPMVSRNRLAAVIQDQVLRKAFQPILGRDMWKDCTQRL